jgi:hypothetical protein
MKSPKFLAVAAGAAALVLPVGMAGAQTAETTTTPAPPGSSEAVALNVLDLVVIGQTKAKADGSSGEGSATSLGLLGDEPLIDGETGGSQKGKGKKEGSLFDSGNTPVGRVMVTPWGVEVQDDGSTRSSESDAALLKLILVNSSTASVNVLHTNSKASHTDQKSTGRTSSDGVKANVGGQNGVTVTLLHSETSSEANGSSSYLIGVNNTKVGTSDSGGSCVVTAPGVITLGCLQAAGGQGSSSAAAAQGKVNALGNAPLAVSAGNSAFGSGQSGSPEVLPADVSRDPATEPEVIGASTGTGSGLAFTGNDLSKGLGLGIALLALGFAVLQLRRSPVTA